MDLKVTQYAVVDQVGLITLNRPDRLNAWTGRMHAEYRHLITNAEADPEIRVIVVTGAGRGFCAGADSQALEGHAAAGRYDDGLGGVTPATPPVPEAFAADFAFQLGMHTPVIAAVNGAAAGVGLAVCCFADIRFGAAGAKFTTAAPKLGLPAEYGLSWLLPRLIGAGPAAEVLLSGRVFLAEEAMAMGLLSAVRAPAEVLDHTMAYAIDMARHVSPASLAVTKRQIWGELLSDDLVASVNESKRLIAEMATGPDFAEGARALAERRRPNF